VAELIKKLWQIAWDLWEHRNGVLHKQTNMVLKTRELDIKTRVREHCYQASHLLNHTADAYLLSTPLSQLLLRSIDYQETWLKQASQAIRHQTERMNRRRRKRAV
jgi:hypothetical protein